MSGAHSNAGSRRWAISSLAAGALWLVLAVAPTFVTTLLGLPFAAYALVVGWLSLRGCRQAGDKPGVRLARWSLGLGCAGFIWLVLYYLVIGSALIAAFIALFKAIPTATPIP